MAHAPIADADTSGMPTVTLAEDVCNMLRRMQVTSGMDVRESATYVRVWVACVSARDTLRMVPVSPPPVVVAAFGVMMRGTSQQVIVPPPHPAPRHEPTHPPPGMVWKAELNADAPSAPQPFGLPQTKRKKGLMLPEDPFGDPESDTDTSFSLAAPISHDSDLSAKRARKLVPVDPLTTSKEACMEFVRRHVQYDANARVDLTDIYDCFQRMPHPPIAQATTNYNSFSQYLANAVEVHIGVVYRTRVRKLGKTKYCVAITGIPMRTDGAGADTTVAHVSM